MDDIKKSTEEMSRIQEAPSYSSSESKSSKSVEQAEKSDNFKDKEQKKEVCTCQTLNML
jgi:hypothetical protein